MDADEAALARVLGEPLTLPPGARTSGLDRAAPPRTDADWLARAWPDARGVRVDETGRVLVRDDPPGLVLVAAPDLEAAEVNAGAAGRADVDASAVVAADVAGGERYFLGLDETGRPYFAVPG